MVLYEHCQRDVERYLQEADDLTREFHQYLLGYDVPLSINSIRSYLVMMRKLNRIGKPIPDLTIQEIRGFLTTVKPNTRRSWRSHIRILYEWLGRDDIVEGLKTPKGHRGGRPKRTRIEKDLVRQEEVEAMIQGAYNTMQRALIAVLADSGARMGEVAALALSDIEIQGKIGRLFVDGKTGTRTIPIRDCLPHLQEWLEERPASESDHVWVNIHGEPKPITSLTDVVRSTARKILGRAIGPHQLRHLRATQLAHSLNVAEMRLFFGWSPGSKVMMRYLHPGTEDMEMKLFPLESSSLET